VLHEVDVATTNVLDSSNDIVHRRRKKSGSKLLPTTRYIIEKRKSFMRLVLIW